MWDYPAPGGTEIHTCQPLGPNHVGIMQNGSPAKWMKVNTLTRKVEKTVNIPTRTTNTHGQFRIVRLTEKGTLLAAHMDMRKVSEYDTATGKEIWSAPTKGAPWMAIRLKNGNTLVAVDRQVQELNKAGATVWEVTQKDLPYKISATQTVQRLANGNTLISSWVMGDPASEWMRSVQFFEVTPEKRVVWALKQFELLGPSTTIQLLDEPGIPESFDMQR